MPQPPAAPAANGADGAAPATPPPAADPKAQGKVPEVPPTPKPTGDGGEPPAPEAKRYNNQIEADLAERMGKDGVAWDEMNPKVKEAMIVSEMKSREADKRMQLAAKLKKDLDMTNTQVNQLIGALRKNPWQVLANPALGHDVRKLAESYVWDMVNEERMKAKYSPEEWEAMQRGKKAEAELSEMKSQQEQSKKDQEEREFETLKQQRREHWEREIPKAMEEFKLPKTSYTVARFAHFIKAMSKAKIPVDMGKVASVIKDEISGMQPQFLLPERFANEKPDDYEDRILASVPGDFLKMLRRADLRRLRAKGLAPRPGPKPGQSPSQTPNKKMPMSEWLNQRDQRLGRS